MAIPTNPSLTSICTEALQKSGIGSPAGTALLTRAENQWMEEVKNDIYNTAKRSGSTRFKTLQTFNVQISISGQTKYDTPSDFGEEILLTLLEGTHTGIAQAGGNTSITLESGENATEEEVEGNSILLTDGTGKVGLRQSVDYNTTTEIATVDSAWDTNPDATSIYVVIDKTTEINEEGLEDIGSLGTSFQKGKPNTFMIKNEGVNNKIVFNQPFDSALYGILLEYYVNIHNIDLTEGSTLISKIFKNWHSVLLYGVYVKALDDADDDRYAAAKSEYMRMKGDLLIKELPHVDEFEGFEVER